MPSPLLQNLPSILWHLDDPLADPNIVATWTLAGAASQYGPYTFSGMGADEVLAGHTRFLLTEESPSASVIATEFLKPVVKMLQDNPPNGGPTPSQLIAEAEQHIDRADDSLDKVLSLL